MSPWSIPGTACQEPLSPGPPFPSHTAAWQDPKPGYIQLSACPNSRRRQSGETSSCWLECFGFVTPGLKLRSSVLTTVPLPPPRRPLAFHLLQHWEQRPPFSPTPSTPSPTRTWDGVCFLEKIRQLCFILRPPNLPACLCL